MSGRMRRRTSAATTQRPAPAINLLPVSFVRQREGRRRVRRAWLGAIVAGIVVAAAIGLSLSAAVAARAELTSAQTSAQAAVAERGRYADVERLLREITKREAAQRAANSKHIDWDSTLTRIRAALPEGVTVSQVTAAAASPLEDLTEPDAPISAQPEATIELTVRSAALPTVTGWIDLLSDVPGYIDAFPGTTTEDEGIYAVNITLHLNKDALSSEDN